MKIASIALLVAASSLLTFAQSKTAPAAQDWRTPAEISDYRTTPRYAETFAYIRRIAQAAPKQVRLETFGKTGEGRDLVAVIVSKDGVFDPATLHKQNRPIMLIQNAIHAGEMDGKDACMALMRDILITKQKAALIDRAVLVIIPIYNADGHERFGPYNRINQNGPEQMGWRTTARNFNLNRDYMKADASETRAFLDLINKWVPDFFVDDHVTDGADYQFVITYSIASGPDVNPALARWIDGSLKPYVKQSVEAAGHLIAPYIWLRDETDPSKGFGTGQDTPRFSTGHMILRNRPGYLVEMHMLKDYKTRVTGNYEVLRALLEVINRDADKLVQINREADENTIAVGKTCGTPRVDGTGEQRGDNRCLVPLKLQPTGKAEPFLYKGYKFTREKSDISGDTWVRYTNEPYEAIIPRQSELTVTQAAYTPRAYIIPAQWTPVIDVLRAHGLELLSTTKPYEAEVQTYRCERPTWGQQPFEGHHLATWKTPNPCKLVREKMSFAANSVVVPMDQRAAKVAIHLLEPEGPDSLLQWGFFDTIFEQKEYGEGYVLERLARDMIAKDPGLRAEFEQKLATDKEFAASPSERLNWFYKRSPWWDTTLGLYPVARLATLEGVPIK
ncbi:MAG TPA: M14 family metallopeptidase [Terriglobales bacterium]|nr:M14 family metallopeptidase [Terriglobales bacterium]